MKKLFVLMALTAVMHLPISCGSDHTDCSSENVELFIEQMEGDFGRYSNASFTSSALRDTIEYQSAVLLLRVTMSRTVLLTAWRSSLFMSSSLACSPIPPSLGHNVSSIKITSDSPMFSGGTSFEANSSINDLFEIAVTGETIFYSIDEFIGGFSNISRNGYFGDEFSALRLRLKNQPDVVVNQDFSVEVLFDDNVSLDLNVDAVLIR